jgi:hypothetical protein
MDTLGKFFAGLIMVVISIIISGFMFFKLWAWFIMPVFISAPKLTFAQSVGISVFLSIIFARKYDTKEKDFDEVIESFIGGILLIAVLFLFAWIVYLFIH